MVHREHSLQSRPRTVPFKLSHKSFNVQLLAKITGKKIDNPLLYKALLHAKSHSQFVNILNSDETLRMHLTRTVETKQRLKKIRSNIKQQLRKKYVENWLKTRQSTSDSSREKVTHKNIKTEYQLELRLRVHSSYEYKQGNTKIMGHQYQFNQEHA